MEKFRIFKFADCPAIKGKSSYNDSIEKLVKDGWEPISISTVSNLNITYIYALMKRAK